MIPFDDLSTSEQTRYVLAYLYWANKDLSKSEFVELANCVSSDLFVNSVISFEYQLELLADTAEFYTSCYKMLPFWLTRLSMIGL